MIFRFMKNPSLLSVWSFRSSASRALSALIRERVVGAAARCHFFHCERTKIFLVNKG